MCPVVHRASAAPGQPLETAELWPCSMSRAPHAGPSSEGTGCTHETPNNSTLKDRPQTMKMCKMCHSRADTTNGQPLMGRLPPAEWGPKQGGTPWPAGHPPLAMNAQDTEAQMAFAIHQCSKIVRVGACPRGLAQAGSCVRMNAVCLEGCPPPGQSPAAPRWPWGSQMRSVGTQSPNWAPGPTAGTLPA